ncbi:MAG: helix-hairpin-helix domain-containing protein [Nocardioides sp.]
MRSKRLGTEHQAAVSRRLALLGAELSAEREAESAMTSSGPWRAPPTHTRIRPDRIGPAPTRVREAAEADVPTAVPVPGRHARRRSALSTGRLRGGWPGAAAIGPGQLAVVALAVAVGLAVTCWWLVRSSPSEVVGPGMAPVSAAAPLISDLASPASTASAPTGQLPVELVVDVAGKVRRPGIAVLAPGSRVVDALDAAGGVRSGVDLAGLNLARTLVDGEQILVGVPPAPGVAAGVLAAPSAPGVPGPLVPLNTAGQAELESLPEVGPVTAVAIIAWRDEHGGFTAVDELLEVDGIGAATLGQLAPLVTL